MRIRTTRMGLALLCASAGLLFAAAPAGAQQPCGSIPDVVDDTVDFHVLQLNEVVGIPVDDEQVCAKLTRLFVKGCRDAVRRVISCFGVQISALSKELKYACKATQGAGAGACVADVRDDVKASKQGMNDFEAELVDDCETSAADDYFDYCMNGF